MRKGFTMIETIIALGVLLVGLVGVIKMQLVGSMATTHSADIITARNLVQSHLDQFVSLGPDAILGPVSDTDTTCRYPTDGIAVPEAPNNLKPTILPNMVDAGADGKENIRSIDFNFSYKLEINQVGTRIIGENTTCSAFDKLTRAAMVTVFVTWRDRLSGGEQKVQASTLITYQ